jgi:hypothetical protein
VIGPVVVVIQSQRILDNSLEPLLHHLMKSRAIGKIRLDGQIAYHLEAR